jgi:hypothetical protein
MRLPRALKIGKIADGGMPPTCETMHYEATDFNDADRKRCRNLLATLAMLMIVPPVCTSGTAYLIPKNVPPSNRPIDLLNFSTDVPAIATFTTYSGVISRRENSDLVQAA